MRNSLKCATTRIYRCIRRYMIKDSRVTRRLFKLRQIDKGCLSFENGALSTAENAYNRLNAITHDVQGVTYVIVGDCRSLQLKVEESPSKKNPYHCHVDISKDEELLSWQLYKCASMHKICYPEYMHDAYRWEIKIN